MEGERIPLVRCPFIPLDRMDRIDRMVVVVVIDAGATTLFAPMPIIIITKIDTFLLGREKQIFTFLMFYEDSFSSPLSTKRKSGKIGFSLQAWDTIHAIIYSGKPRNSETKDRSR